MPLNVSQTLERYGILSVILALISDLVPRSQERGTIISTEETTK